MKSFRGTLDVLVARQPIVWIRIQIAAQLVRRNRPPRSPCNIQDTIVGHAPPL